MQVNFFYFFSLKVILIREGNGIVVNGKLQLKLVLINYVCGLYGIDHQSNFGFVQNDFGFVQNVEIERIS